MTQFHGRTADILPYDAQRILKLFHVNRSEAFVRHEAEVTNLVHEARLPAPRVYEVIKEDNRWGIIYERIQGLTLSCYLMKHPWRLHHMVKQAADLQYQIHQHVVTGLPLLTQQYRDQISRVSELSVSEKESLLKQLAVLPQRTSLCHGDCNPDNVILSDNRLVLIDWSNAASGNPEADVARTTLLIRLGQPPPGTSHLANMMLAAGRKFLALDKRYLAAYYQNQEPPAFFDQWSRLTAAARLADQIAEEKDKLLHILRSGLQK
jgi:aminoglycoside phosphotransferase (APT) family kinase protein